MDSPVDNIRGLIRSIVEPDTASEILSNIDKYFTPTANIIHPLLNSPKAAGRDGLKSAYQMLRVLTYDNRMEFHAVGFDKEIIRKGIPHQTGLIDCTEHLRLRFIPFSPVFSPRFLVRIDLVKVNMDGGARELGKWYVEQQEDNLPTDFGRSGLAFLPGSRLVSDLIKWGLGVGTLVAGNAFGYLNLV